MLQHLMTNGLSTRTKRIVGVVAILLTTTTFLYINGVATSEGLEKGKKVYQILTGENNE